MQPRHSKPLTPCHSHWVRLYASTFLTVLMTGYYNFDEELVAPNVTATYLQDIEKRTSIDHPDGSNGEAFYWDGSGRDPSMWAKIHIPSDKVDALRALMRNCQTQTRSMDEILNK